MSTASDPDRAGRKPDPIRRIRMAAKRWGKRIRFALAPGLANRGYAICATPRSGSTYLCQLLTNTQVLGKPLEYFNTPGQRRDTDPKYPKDPRRQLEIVRSTGATRNGIYAVKLLPMHLKLIAGAIDPFRDLPNLSLVRLERRDLLGQAISLVRARQTRQFVATQPQDGVPVYDAQRIRDNLRSLLHQRGEWTDILTRFGASPVVVEYEDLAAQPQRIVDRIAALMRLATPVSVDPALITHTIQRDNINAEWRRRFLDDAGDEFPGLLP